MSTYINPDAIMDNSIGKEKLAKELIDENYMLNIGAATGTIQSAVFNTVKAAKTVSINYNSGQYVVTITSREKSGSNYRYSAMFPAMDSTFKMFMIDFTVSNSSNAVSYTVTLANLAIGAATVSE